MLADELAGHVAGQPGRLYAGGVLVVLATLGLTLVWSSLAPLASAVVAPGISEALFATAIGLFAAIPAVIAYNRFSARVAGLGARYYSFGNELQGRLQRRLHSSASRVAVAA